ncbi:23 kDa integral membrane protein [Biomphalaria pfeifferi]|uniref:23 kDa integral membrane protein n=1 Tax=Biomphalaria pfeifferi TaxID=112525 RepID=A0AAD8BN29_BIOPF|nr:23 kDa integral membrane protein [Biomphalaria pfeifferi]
MLGAVAKLVFLLINCFVLVAGLLMIIFGMTFYFSPYLHLPDLVKRSEKYSGYTLPKQLRDMKEFPIANEFGLALALVGMFLALLSLMAIVVVCLTCGDIFYIVYALLVFLMVIAEITLCILFLNSNSVLHKNIKEDLKEKVRNEYVDQGNDTFSETLNLIHVYFQCCGITGESDFGGKSSQSCRAHNQTMGCYTKLMEEIQKNLAWITTILLLLILLQMIEIFLASSVYFSNRIVPFL